MRTGTTRTPNTDGYTVATNILGTEPSYPLVSAPGLEPSRLRYARGPCRPIREI